jgi:hypothetical protein
MANVGTSQAKRRKDPVRRSYDGSFTYDLSDKNPKHQYVWTHPTADTGVNYYLSLGYDFVRQGPDAPRIRGRKRQNPFMKLQPGAEDLIMQGDMVLMFIDRAEYEATVKDAQAEMTDIERRILSKSVNELLRGINVRGRDGNPILAVENETVDEGAFDTREE